MVQAYEQMVRECAYYLWIDSGRKEGMAYEHWVAAERTITSELSRFDLVRPASSARKTVGVSKAKTTKKADSASASKDFAKTQDGATQAGKAKIKANTKSVAVSAGKKSSKGTAVLHGATTH